MPYTIDNIVRDHDVLIKQYTKKIQYLENDMLTIQSDFANIEDFNKLKSKVERSISNNKKYNWISRAKHRMR